jgi:hypothetical protein
MDTSELLAELTKKLERLQKLEEAFGGTASTPSGKGKRKPMSAEARAKIAAAQKKRWAKAKG